ncbi:MAG: ubiquitin-like small modifier protein 1 [Planctomycetota bacterium]|jgi:molybdopterin synthase sulfur carrier subunit
MDVNFFATLRDVAGSRTLSFDLAEGVTVRELLDHVMEKFPIMREKLFDENGELFGHVHVFINGRDAPHLDRALETPLTNADKVDLFPAVGGG